MGPKCKQCVGHKNQQLSLLLPREDSFIDALYEANVVDGCCCGCSRSWSFTHDQSYANESIGGDVNLFFAGPSGRSAKKTEPEGSVLNDGLFRNLAAQGVTSQ